MGMRDLDDRILGRRGVLAVVVVLAATALAGGVAATVRSDTATAVVAYVVAVWAGYWAVRRWRSPRV